MNRDCALELYKLLAHMGLYRMAVHECLVHRREEGCLLYEKYGREIEEEFLPATEKACDISIERPWIGQVWIRRWWKE